MVDITLCQDMSGGESKVQCCKEQYRIGTWNVRSMNQGILDAVKQEITRLNIYILGISKLKWIGIRSDKIRSDQSLSRVRPFVTP